MFLGLLRNAPPDKTFGMQMGTSKKKSNHYSVGHFVKKYCIRRCCCFFAITRCTDQSVDNLKWQCFVLLMVNDWLYLQCIAIDWSSLVGWSLWLPLSIYNLVIFCWQVVRHVKEQLNVNRVDNLPSPSSLVSYIDVLLSSSHKLPQVRNCVLIPRMSMSPCSSTQLNLNLGKCCLQPNLSLPQCLVKM